MYKMNKKMYNSTIYGFPYVLAMKKTISVNYNIKYQRQPGHGVTNDLLFLQKNKLAAVMEYKKDGFSNQRSIVVPRSVQEMQTTNELTRLLYVTDIGYYPNAVGHYRTRSEGSPQHILIHCVDGEGWFSINGSRQNVQKGQFFLLEAGVPHTYVASRTNPWSIYWIHFTGQQSHVFRSMFNHVFEITETAEARLQERLTLFEEIFLNLETGYSPDNLSYASSCLWHLLASYRYIVQFRTIKRIRHTDFAQTAIAYMRSHLGERLTLDDIARSANYSPSHFGQLFLRHTGCTPLHYFNQLKIQRACQLLDFTDARIKEIAEQLGFFDQYHFTKAFVRYMGETPSRYRKHRSG